MSKKLTVLFAPLDAVGPVNSLTGIAEAVRDRGHKVVFVVSESWKNKLNIHGFDEEIIPNQDEGEVQDAAAYYADFAVKAGLFLARPPIDKLKDIMRLLFSEMIEIMKKNDPFLTEIVNRVKPDVIIIDNYFFVPALMDGSIPWVLSMSSNALSIDVAVDDENIPPSSLGLDTNGDREEWKRIRAELKKDRRDIWQNLNDWIESKGLPQLPNDMLLTSSPFLNIYMFPKELDYEGVIPSNWHQFDCFTRSGKLDSFEMPEQLKNKPGKLIFLSMGSMGGADVRLMKRLVSILSKTNHRYIVSKGPLSDQYELADNMWGERTVPQIKVLPTVDLVITHGGNNSVTEIFYFGKPLIVMPLFFDQYDNAQRVQEKGLGLRLDPYNFEDNDLVDSIEKIVNDQNLAQRFRQISERIQNAKNTERAAKMIEDLIK